MFCVQKILMQEPFKPEYREATKQWVVAKLPYDPDIRERVEAYLRMDPDYEAWHIEGCVEIRTPKVATEKGSNPQ